MSFFTSCSEQMSKCINQCSKRPSNNFGLNEKGLFKSYRMQGNTKKVPETPEKSCKKSIKQEKSLHKKTAFRKKYYKPQPFDINQRKKKEQISRKNNIASGFPQINYLSPQVGPEKMNYKTTQINNHFSPTLSSFPSRSGDRYFGYNKPNKEIGKLNPSSQRVTFSFGKQKVSSPTKNIQTQPIPKVKNYPEKSIEKHSTSPSEILYYPFKRMTNSQKQIRGLRQYYPSIIHKKNKSFLFNKEPKEVHENCFLKQNNPWKNLKKKSDFFPGKTEHGHTRYSSDIFWKTNRPEFPPPESRVNEQNASESCQENLDEEQSPEIHINLVNKDTEELPVRIKQEQESNEDEQVKFNLSVIGANNLDELDLCRKTQSIHDSDSEKDHFSDLVSLNSMGKQSDMLTKLLFMPKKQNNGISKSAIRNREQSKELQII